MRLIQAERPNLVLASASATRVGLMTAAGLCFEAQAADIDETSIKIEAQAAGRSVEDAALRLAEMKARTVAENHPDALVIGADQILVCEGAWYDKPADIGGARAHLVKLRGREHRLVSAIVCVFAGDVAWRHVAAPRLVMRDFSDAFLDVYLHAEGDAVTKSVGAYRVEGFGAHLFAGIAGEQAAILGLPMLPLLAFLRRAGVLLG